jgi:Mg/Co/Ni transporter MgtE
MNNSNLDKNITLDLLPLLNEERIDEAIILLNEYRAEDIADIFWDIELDDAKFLIKIVDKSKAVSIINSLDEATTLSKGLSSQRNS